MRKTNARLQASAPSAALSVAALPAVRASSQPSNGKPNFFALGYVGHKPAELLALVRSVPQAILLDVRFAPRSRAPMWNKSALQSLLGSQYVHCGAWGNQNYKVPGMENVKLVDFDGGLQAALASGAQNIFLMCACKDHEHCHRTTVADKLRERGFTVNEVQWRFVEPVRTPKHQPELDLTE